MSRVYLRGVDWTVLEQKYLRGDFSGTSEIVVTTTKLTPLETPRVVTDVSKTKKEFACISHRVVDKSEVYVPRSNSGTQRCMYCLREIDDVSLGIPVKREEKNGKIVYHTLDIFCSYACVITELHHRRPNSLYQYSLAYLSELYMLSTGGNFSQIKPARDKRVLKIFNGPLDWDEFHSNTQPLDGYSSTVRFLPVEEYIF